MGRSTVAIVLMLLAGALAPMVATSAGTQTEMLVQVVPGADAAGIAARAGASLDARIGDVAVLSGPPHAMARLARDPGVAAVEADGTVRAAASSWDGASWDASSWDGASWDGASWDGASWDGASWDGASWDGASWDGASWDSSGETAGVLPPWGLFAIHAPSAWRTLATVEPRLVCTVDSGLDVEHPALAPRVWVGPDGARGYNAIDGGADVSDPAGHGTHVAGIVAATRDQPWPGVSTATLAAAKALAADGHGETSDVIAALAWCDSIDADVILLALTEDDPTRAFRAAIASAQRNGALIVAAAGNDGPCERCVGSPADLPGVLAVGAFAPDGSLASFASNGPEVDVLAPGVLIASSVPGGGFRAASGTSQAAAFVAGAAALAWSACPGWNAPQVAHALVAPGRATALELDNERIASCQGA